MGVFNMPMNLLVEAFEAKGLSPLAKLMLIYLANNANMDGIVHAGGAEAFCGVSADAAEAACAELVAAGHMIGTFRGAFRLMVAANG